MVCLTQSSTISAVTPKSYRTPCWRCWNAVKQNVLPLLQSHHHRKWKSNSIKKLNSIRASWSSDRRKSAQSRGDSQTGESFPWTPPEVDIYGNVNSTHVNGSSMMNGIGGSGILPETDLLPFLQRHLWQKWRYLFHRTDGIPCRSYRSTMSWLLLQNKDMLISEGAVQRKGRLKLSTTAPTLTIGKTNGLLQPSLPDQRFADAAYFRRSLVLARQFYENGTMK